MDQFKGKKILIVGIGQTGFKLINFFNKQECLIKVTDLKPIFDLNKAVKKLKKINPMPEMTFGEHREEDFLTADVVVYCAGVNPNLPQIKAARDAGKKVFSEFSLANFLCKKPIIAVCGTNGRTTVSHMIGFALKLEGNQVFVGGTSNTPFIEFCLMPEMDTIDYVVVEVSAVQMRSLNDFHPRLVVFTDIGETYPQGQFESISDYLETKLSIIKKLSPEDSLVINFDKLSSNAFLRNANCNLYWYSRKSFVKMGVADEVQGTHFHDKRIHSNIGSHTEYRVRSMRIVGQSNRENLLAAVTAARILDVSDKSIQKLIEKFPGIPHRVEFVIEKNGVLFYNDSKSEKMEDLVQSLSCFKQRVILIAGGKDDEEFNYEPYSEVVSSRARVMVLVGECKERMNRGINKPNQTYLVGSFEESVLLAYQKSRNGDVVLLSPGNSASDFFRDFEERGNYFKKLVFQI